MIRLASYLCAAGLFLAAGYGLTWLAGPLLSPPPHTVMTKVWDLILSGDAVRELVVTVGRALGGIALANVLGLALGLAAGRILFFSRAVSPLVTAMQACPPIVWVSLILVWAGTGTLVPMAAVFMATLPPLFVNVAQGARGLNPRLFAMSRVFDVPWPTRLTRLLVPGVFPFWLAGFSHTLTAGWKVAAMAEYLGSHDGVGARIFWAYRRLDMVELYAWVVIVVALGLALECGLVAWVRGRLHRRERGDKSC